MVKRIASISLALIIAITSISPTISIAEDNSGGFSIPIPLPVTIENTSEDPGNVTIVDNGELNAAIVIYVNTMENSEANWRPLLKDVVGLKERLLTNIQDKNYLSYAIADQGYQTRKKSSYDRPEMVMGADILDIQDRNNGTMPKDVNITSLTKDTLNDMAALTTLIYKAVATTEYRVETWSEDFKLVDGKTPKVSDTKLLGDLGISNKFINPKSFLQYVYITRTPYDYKHTVTSDGKSGNMYLDRALKDRIITKDDLGYDPTDLKQDSKTKDLTTVSKARFAVLLRDVLYLYGEEELTASEEQMATVALGKSLPTNLNGEDLRAVRYLMARGIIDDNVDFTEELTVDFIKKALMRAGDKDSRLVFKNVSVPYNEALVADEYHPVELASDTVPVDIIGAKVNKPMLEYWVKSDVLAGYNPATRDFFDESEGYLKFKTDKGNEKLGVKFKVSKGSSEFYLKLEYGGGIYQKGDINTWEDKDKFGDIKRLPYTTDYTSPTIETLSDWEDTNETAYTPIKSFAAGSTGNKGNILYFHWSGDIKNLLYKGKEIVATSVGDASDNIFQVTLQSNEPYREFMANLSVKGATNSQKYPAYVRDDKNMFIGTTYLKQHKIIKDPIPIQPANTIGRYLFNSTKGLILVDTETRICVAGNKVLNLKDDKSPLIINDNGYWMIDSRIALAVTGGNFKVINIGKSKISALAVIGANGVTQTRPLYNTQGKPLWRDIEIKMDKDKKGEAKTARLLLDRGYQYSNYIIFSNYSGGNSQEYFVSFYKSSASYKSTPLKDNVLSRMGIVMQPESKENLKVIELSQDKILNSKYLASSKKEAEYGMIYYDPTLNCWLTKIPRLKDGGGSITTRKNLELYVNTPDDASKDKVFYNLLCNQYGDSSFSYVDSLLSRDGSYPKPSQLKSVGMKESSLGKSDAIIMAPTGISARYVLYETKKWSELVNNTRNQVLFGQELYNINYNTSKSKYELKLGDIVVYEVGSKESEEQKFQKVGYSKDNNPVWLLTTKNSTVYSFNPDSNPNLGDFFDSIIGGKLFDKDSFLFKMMLSDLDAGVTFLILIGLGVLTRLVMGYLFILFIVIMIMHNRFMQRLGEATIDPVSFMTAGLRNMYQGSIISYFISMTVGLVLIDLLSQQTLLRVLAKIVEMGMQLFGAT